MKTKEQILKYVAQCSFEDSDWQRVIDYCTLNYNVKRMARGNKNLPMSTFDEFKLWIKYGFGVGDIVKYGNVVGVLGYVSPNYVYLSAYLSLDGELIQNKLELLPHKLIAATEDEAKNFQDTMYTLGWQFSLSLSACVPMYKPKNGEIVRITTDSMQTVGIVRCIVEGLVSFYAYVDGDKIVRDRGMLLSECVFSTPTKTELFRLQEALAKNRMEWSPRHKTLKMVGIERAEKRGRYWYLSDRLAICSDIDGYTKTHNERFQVGNYFVSYQAAILFMQKVKALVKENGQGA